MVLICPFCSSFFSGVYLTDTYKIRDFNAEDYLIFAVAFSFLFFFPPTYFIFFSSIALYRLVIILRWYNSEAVWAVHAQ